MRWMQRVIAVLNRNLRFHVLRLFMVVLMLGAVSAAAPSIQADPIVVGGNWYEFQFLGPGSQGTACVLCTPSIAGNSQFAPNPPWTFTLSQAGILTVTDAFNIGDSFDVFDFGVLIGSTPPVAQFDTCGSDPVPCSMNPNVSHAVFSLAVGPHAITIMARDPAIAAGAAYFRVDEVPDPTTLLLLATGLGGAISVRKNRKINRR